MRVDCAVGSESVPFKSLLVNLGNVSSSLWQREVFQTLHGSTPLVAYLRLLQKELVSP